MTDYKKIISQNIKLEGATAEEIYSQLSYPTDAAMGDYCLPCFKYAKLLRKNPAVIAT